MNVAPMLADTPLFILIGFAAQLVDGAIGMAYGLISTSMLLSFGIPPAMASASVHTAEVFTTGISGLAHWRLKNIDFSLVKRLAPAGMLGGFIGAYILATSASEKLRFIIACYLVIMGGYVLYRGVRKAIEDKPAKNIPILGFIGGLVDAIGGGGWGSIVTTHLVGQGTHPRTAIGSTNLSEFFVTATISATFLMTIGLQLWPIILGLVIGGAIAAPIAAMATKKLPVRLLMIMVGLVIIGLSLRTAINAGSSIF